MVIKKLLLWLSARGEGGETIYELVVLGGWSHKDGAGE